MWGFTPFGWTVADPFGIGSCLWVLELDFPSFLMVILGLDRRRMGHRSLEQRCLSFVLRIVSIGEKWLVLLETAWNESS